MKTQNAEFQNYERELKYLLTEGKLSLEEILDFLKKHGYELEETKQKEKHEAYHDDKKLTLINRGDVLRSSKHVTDGFSAFMFKQNVSDTNKPYVSKLELGTGQYKTRFNSLEEYVAALGLDLDIQSDPVLYARLMRDTAVVARSELDRLLISLDNVDYFKTPDAPITHEKMLEIEDWVNPNTVDVNYDNDAHLCGVNELLLGGGLPIRLTKHTKPYRGCKVLMEEMLNEKE